jgi:hypothetical protein
MDRPARRRWRRLALGVALVALAAFDLSRPPQSQASARAMLLAIHGYQATLSPLMPVLGVRCRFRPTCSHYAEGALRKHGALAGSALALRRLARCGPWTPLGTYDPP